jgi:hypothetical protein
MKQRLAVFNSDQINKKMMKIPASVLMRAEENHRRDAFSSQAPVGMPVHIQHDMHRPVGWSRPLGHYIDGEMVRVLGSIECPESEDERCQMEAAINLYKERVKLAEISEFQNEILSKISNLNDSNIDFLRSECVFARREGIAAEVYPELFTQNTLLVDKDGLVDYRELLSRFEEVMPGVFHDKERDIIVVAHRFFRRRLSHLNALNSDFLISFSKTAIAHPELRARLKLDPDLIGHPLSARSLVELEYWHGPKYNDDIDKIPNGVAEHKADNYTREYEGVDRTQVWWKAPETRVDDDVVKQYRTFEVEELVEDPSPGLLDEHYGCRYAHAEYSLGLGAITHFDGAIRAYHCDDYLTRIDNLIDKAGKQSSYTKLFRFDGELPVSDWKRLLSDYYRGNNLIPEYLGYSTNSSASTVLSSAVDEKVEAPLAAFISLGVSQLEKRTMLYPESSMSIGTQHVPIVELGVGAVAKYLDGKHNKNVVPVGFYDDILNLSRLGIVVPNDCSDLFSDEIKGLSDALEEDVKSGLINRAAIPMMWQHENIVITLTLAGCADLVSALLKKIPNLIDCAKMPSDWIEAVALSVAELAPVKDAAVIWEGVNRGVLAIERSNEVMCRFPETSLASAPS